MFSKFPRIKRSIESGLFGSGVASTLFLLDAVPLSVWLVSNNLRNPFVLAFGSFPPACASVALMGLCCAFPDLVAGHKVRFPLNVTLPAVYSCLTVMTSHVLAMFRTPMALIGEEARIDQIWRRWDIVALAWFVQTCVLSVVAWLQSRREKVT